MAATQKRDIQGSSTRTHCIQAMRDSSTGTYLVYVGRLSADTTADNVRRHLANENVNNIADVFDLKGKLRAKQASFCVSFDNETAMKNNKAHIIFITKIINIIMQ